MKEGYKDTLISKIPSDWVVLPLGIIGDTFNGLTGKTKVDFGQGKPYITYMNIYSNPKLKNNFNDFVQIGEEENQNKVQYGDIFFTTSSETAGEVGFSSVLLDKVDECYLNSFCFGFRMKNFETLLPEYAVYVLRGEKTRKIISVLAQGSTRFNLSKITLLKKLKLALPPLPEQQKIAEILSTVDAKTAIIDQQITETQELKKGFMQRLLTKGIGHTEFKESALGEIPESWEVVRLDGIANCFVGIASSATHAYTDKGILLIRNQNIKEGRLDISDVLYVTEEYELQHKSKRLKKGDILTVRTGYPGISAVVTEELEGTQSFTTLITRRNNDDLSSEFLCYYINSEIGKSFFNSNKAGGGQKNVGSKTLGTMKVPIPSKEEQSQIVNILKAIDKKLEILLEKKETYQELKKGLMQQLLTGKVRVKV